MLFRKSTSWWVGKRNFNWNFYWNFVKYRPKFHEISREISYHFCQYWNFDLKFWEIFFTEILHLFWPNSLTIERPKSGVCEILWNIVKLCEILSSKFHEISCHLKIAEISLPYIPHALTYFQKAGKKSIFTRSIGAEIRVFREEWKWYFWMSMVTLFHLIISQLRKKLKGHGEAGGRGGVFYCMHVAELRFVIPGGGAVFSFILQNLDS